MFQINNAYLKPLIMRRSRIVAKPNIGPKAGRGATPAARATAKIPDVDISVSAADEDAVSPAVTQIRTVEPQTPVLIPSTSDHDPIEQNETILSLSSISSPKSMDTITEDTFIKKLPEQPSTPISPTTSSPPATSTPATSTAGAVRGRSRFPKVRPNLTSRTRSVQNFSTSLS